ncbi:MAG: YIP1 family protein [Actinomycetota bacterium]|nr:YIP1 family protein [Actinomycetota bacterium]
MNWIPIIGPLLALYGIYLSIVGIREMHETTTDKGALVVLIPFVVVFLLAFQLGLLPVEDVFLAQR